VILTGLSAATTSNQALRAQILLEAKAFFNFGVVEITESGDLTVRCVNGEGKDLWACAVPRAASAAR
jgi:hypothetical protein